MWNGIVSFFAGDDGVSAAAAGDEIQTVTDGSTLNGWNTHLTDGSASTENIGRIWTDKTVDDADVKLTPANIEVNKGDSDFLVGLSALSSMSSITTETTRPLDIVLVLDLSGSMNDSMGAAKYSSVSANDVSTDPAKAYYVNYGGSYHKVTYWQTAWYCQDNGKYYWPNGRWQRPGDYVSEVTFYEISNSKMSALQDAVNGFIDATATVNNGITDQNLKHQISIVKFANNLSDAVGNDTYKDTDDATVNYSQVVTNLAIYNSSNANSLKNTVNSLVAAGSTRADYGMTLANQQLDNNGRPGAQKAVIFFTDGEPNGGSGFDDDVANTAIQQGSEMNSEGTLVYTVGVFEGANSDQTDYTQEPAGKFNAYMNALSSKYPYAQSYKDLGSPAGTHEYYRTADDADELSQVFTDIAADLQTATSGSPITSASGGGEGYITFSDELGQYMKVDDFKSIVYANTKFTEHSSKTDGNTTTYTFTGDVKDPNGVFTEGDMKDIVITVTKDPDNLAQGDKVTVQIPASLLPMRNYKAKVEKDGKITWQGVTDAYPIRVFYGVSLKDGVADAIKNGTADDALKAYVATHTGTAEDAAGKKHEAVSFLSNLYESGNDGTTTATFTPAKTNGYYYVDQYTPLYVDEACEEPLTKESWGTDENHPDTFYYKQTVYQQDKNEPQTVTQSFPVSTFAEGAAGGIVVQGDNGAYGLAAGSPRLSRIRDLLDVKNQDLGSNETETATNVANPNWDNKNANAEQITVNLGNNGKMFVELPGQLHVSKTVTVDSGLDKTQFADKGFDFTVFVDGMAGRTVKAQVVKTADGSLVKELANFTFNEQNKATATLKDGETLVISGLDDGVSYEVSEDVPQNEGWTNTNKAGNTGEISSKTAAQASFTNNYGVQQVELADGIKAQKAYLNRDGNTNMDWDGVTFDFVIKAAAGASDGSGSHDVNNKPIAAKDVPMPEGAAEGVKQKTVKNADPFYFGSITYTKPGTYVYDISEQSPKPSDASWRAGVDYSGAVYHVTVVVKDDGKGGLSIDPQESFMYMERDDDGKSTGKSDSTDTAVITNYFDEASQAVNFMATKSWKDNSGSRPTLTENQFTYVLEAVQAENSNGDVIAGETVPMPEQNHEVGNAADGSVQWESVKFTNAMNGNTYVYHLYEKQPTDTGKIDGNPVAGATKVDNKLVYRGVTYDNAVYTAKVAVHVDVDSNGKQTVKADVKYYDAENNLITQGEGSAEAADRAPFANSYSVNPTPVHSELQVKKTLDGRAMAANETFTFSLVQTEGPKDGVSGLSSPVTVKGDGKKTFNTVSFGTPSFAKPGTYKFEIRETNANGEQLTEKDDIDGMTYDKHVATVTYVVNDTSGDDPTAADYVQHTGNLRVVSRTFDNSTAGNESDRAESELAAFTNTYEASVKFGGITVSKKLTGRDMRANEFTFTITALDAAGHEVPAADKLFTNPTGAASGLVENMTGKLSGLTFTQDDANKTFTYIIDEVKPSETTDGEGNAGTDLMGVTYDETRYKLTIRVTDDGKGTMGTEWTIVPVDKDNNPVDGDQTAPVTVAAFENSYVPEPSEPVTFSLNKVLSGRDWTSADKFSFDFEKVSFNSETSGANFDAMPLPKATNDGDVTNVKLNEDGSLIGKKSGEVIPFSFGSLTFAKAGTYVYKVTEDNKGQTINGMTYANTDAEMTIVVRDNQNGKLEIVGTPQIANGTFTNTYKASQYFDDAVDFQIAKTLHGHEMKAGQFFFKVEAKGGNGTTAEETARKAGMPSTSVEVPGKKGEDGIKAIMMDGEKQLSFNQGDSGKTFVLKFSEVQTNKLSGYDYDNAVYTMEITPTDLGNGTMSVATMVTKKWTDDKGIEQTEAYLDTTNDAWQPGEQAAPLELDFTNYYNSKGTLSLSGKKSIASSKSPWTGDASGFKFQIKQVNDKNEAITDSSVTLPTGVAVSDANGAFSINDIQFTEPGNYRFEVSEVVPGPDDSGRVPGIKYDADPVYLDVTVTENDGEHGNGKLDVDVKVNGEDFDAAKDELAFTNTYETTDAKFTPVVTKHVVGLDAVEHFNFELSTTDKDTQKAIDEGVVNGSGLTEGNEYKTTKSTGSESDPYLTAGSSKDVAFGEMTFTKAGTYIFQVRETNTRPNESWTYASNVYTLKIVVTDVKSVLTPAESTDGVPEDQQGKTFTNSFGATTTYGDQGGLQVTKTLNGRVLEAGKFNFTITADNKDSEAKLAALQNVEAERSFTNGDAPMGTAATMEKLSGLTFTEADINKTYSYTVSEVKPVEPDKLMPGYDYDKDLTAKVKIEVKQEKGKIYTVTTVTKGNAEPVVYNSKSGKVPAVVPFVNSYDASGSFSVEATKKLNNRDLKGEEFEFGIVPKGSYVDGKVVTGVADFATATNDANGSIKFPAITLNSTDLNKLAGQDGSYVTKNVDGSWTVSYTAYEKTNNLPEGVTADKKSFDFTVTVTDNGNGTLTATPNYPSDGANFENTYGKSAKAFATVAATKTLHGRDQQDGEFKFSVKQGNGTEVLTGAGTAGKMDAATAVMFTGKTEGATATEQGVLGEYTFESLKAAVDAGWATGPQDVNGKRQWKLNYSISELTDSTNMPAGVQVTTNHPDHYDFTVTVTDDGAGNLSATTDYPADNQKGKTFDFDNTYGQGETAEVPVRGVKKLEGEFASAMDITGKYTFTLVNEDGSEVTKHKADGFKASATNPDKNGGSVTLGNLKFTMDDIKDVAFGDDHTRSKTFTYKVTETGAVDGVTNDAKAGTGHDKGKTVTVTLTDDGEGNLSATATDFEFVNTYNPGTVTNTPVDVTKKLTGNREQSLKANEFEFEMSVAAKEGSPADGFTMPGDGSNPQVVSNAAPTATEGENTNVGAVKFGDITFTKPGTYTVTVTEKVPSGDKMQPFMEYNVGNNTYSYDVEVKAGGATLTADIVNESVSGKPQFVNNYDKPEKSVSELPEGGVQVGDELTYAIEWANTTDAAAEIAVSDELTKGLAYVDGSQKVEVQKGDAAETVSPDGFKADGQSLSWTFDAEPHTSGTVTFKAKVTEDAVTIEGGKLNNKATITVGDNSSVDTNTVTVPTPKTGDLTISKTVKRYDEGTAAPDQEFTFKVELQDKDGKALEGAYNFACTSDGKAEYKGTIKNGESVKLKADGSITITGLPGGASYRVTEAGVEGAAYQVSYENTWFDALAEGEDGVKGAEVTDATNVGFIAAEKTAKVAVTNTYAPEHVVLPGSDNLKVKKVLDGRDWQSNEKYSFEISAVTEGAPLPESTTLELSKPAQGNEQTASFGDIRFAKAGTYEYMIVETGKSADENLTFSKAEYKVVVTVTSENGALKVNSIMTQVKDDKGEASEASAKDNTAVFTNTYNTPKQVKDVVKPSDPKTSVNGKLVGVGDELTYTIDWVNDAVDKNGAATKAEVSVSDVIPSGTALVDRKDAISEGGELGEDGKTITWNLGPQEANAAGTVSFTVYVTDDAVNVDKIKNEATVTIGENSKKTTTTENDFPKKSVAAEDPKVEGDIQVGDKLVYTIEWANTTGKEADVVITDKLSDGLTFVKASDGGKLGEDGKTVTWNLGKKDDGKSGTVTVTVQVNEAAVKPNADNSNKATISVGNSSNVITNTVPGPQLETGALKVTKTVKADGGAIDKAKDFDFELEVKDKAGEPLTGTYGDHTFNNGKLAFQLKHGEDLTITGLPEGATYKVTEAEVAGYTTTKTGDAGTIKANDTVTAAFTNAYSSTVPGNKPVTVDGLFTKTFTGRTWNTDDQFTFKFVGVDPETGAELAPDAQPMPEKTEVTVAGDGKADVTSKDIDFGKIDFTFDDIKDVEPNADGVRIKQFRYDVYEVVPGDGAGIPGVRYDEHHAHLTITLTDNGKGELSADSQLVATKSVAGSEFHNVYSSKLDYTAVAGIQLQKTLTGRDMTDGQFAFTLSNFSEGAAEKLGLSEGTDAYAVKAAKAGEASTIDLFAGKTLEFTNKDAGKTYSFDVTETKVGGAGYTNDTAVRHVKIAVAYDEASGLVTVTTTVTKDGVAEPVAQTEVTAKTAAAERQVATIPFNNSYEATTENPGGTAATIAAKKELTGRPLEAGEFSFTLTAPDGKTVTAQNDANGNVAFGTFNYKASELEAMAKAGTTKPTTVDGKRGWVLGYTAAESTEGFGGKGLTAERQSFPVTVTVVDNGDGSLTASVAYPAESEGGNVFKNTYNVGEATLSLSGKKVLDHADNLTPNSIEGKFTFTLTDEAGNVIATAKNDANGNVTFGNALKYTLDDFNKILGTAEGEDADANADADATAQDKADEGIDAQAAPRELTYTYYVEEAGSAPGVTNDAAAKKTIQVKVTDDGQGHLTAAVVKDDQALDFTFTNTYKVQPVSSSITDQLSIGKTIDGREMQAGEFVFEMLENGQQVATGKNTEAGTSSKVVFDAIQFTEPGEHDYTVREVDNGKGGVGYDGISYQAHASVKDNGDGTLFVAWILRAGDKPVTEGVVFHNTYEAKPTSIIFNAAKVLTGRDLKAGEFSFQLREDGKVLQTVKNGVDGDAAAIKFDAIAYDKAGEHDYEIVEVKGDDATITYDETAFTYHVSVTDDGNGSLKAVWTAGETGDPVFRNAYTEPPTPEPPTPEPPASEKPGEPKLPQTGDRTPATGVLAAIAAAGAALVGSGVALIKRRR